MASVPSPRSFHFSAGRNRSTFYWGGATWDEAKNAYIPVTDLEYLYELDVATDKWKKHLLTGQHPPGVHHGACAVVGDCLYLYGGKDKEGERTGSLFELNLSTKSWRELSYPGTGGPKKKRSCGMVAYNSTLIIYGGGADDGVTNELHMFDLEAGTWSSPHFTGDVPPPNYDFTFTKVSNHQVVLCGRWENKDKYVLDLSRMHWERHHHSGPELWTGPNLIAAALGLGSDHTQLLLLDSWSVTSSCLLDVATWKWMEMKLPLSGSSLHGSSATAIQISPTSVEVVMYGNELLRLKFTKRPSAPEGVLPVQWWILADYTTELLKPTDPQTSSNTPGSNRDNVDEDQGMSANMPDKIFTPSSEVQSKKSCKEIDEVAAKSENIGFVRNTRNEDDSKASAKLRKYISRIQEQYQNNLDTQIDQKIIRAVAKHLRGWDTKYDLLELDYDEVRDIKEENSSVDLQRIEALSRWKNRVGPDGTYRSLLRILASGEWHDSAKELVAFINNGLGLQCQRLASGSSAQTDRRLNLTPSGYQLLLIPLALVLIWCILR